MFKKQLRTFICKLLFFILEMQKYTFFFNWKGFFVFIKKKNPQPPTAARTAGHTPPLTEGATAAHKG